MPTTIDQRLANQFRDEDSHRREFMLHRLLLGSVILTLVACVSASLAMFSEGSAYSGVNPLFLLVPTVFFGILYGLSFTRVRGAVIYIFLSTYYLLATYVAFRWDFALAQGLVLFILVIAMSGILVGSSFSFATTGLIAVTLVCIAYAQNNGLIHRPPIILTADTINDAIVMIFSLLIITLVAWLSNREIEKSLQRARQSEQALTEERNNLELTVQERTQELQQAQLEKVMEISRFAEWGQFAIGVLHDLVTPLTTVSLNLEQLEGGKNSEIVDRAREATKSMEAFIVTARQQIQDDKKLANFSLKEEIQRVAQLLNHKATANHVVITLDIPHNVTTYGSAVKFYQVVHNLVGNAIEAYAKLPKHEEPYIVVISLKKQNDTAELTVTDAAGGIAPENLDNIFDLFFSTKSNSKGTGIGLAICKDSIERDFAGKISVASELHKGTTFTATFPIEHHESR
jgi:signal transduction histidine kinase